MLFRSTSLLANSGTSVSAGWRLIVRLRMSGILSRPTKLPIFGGNDDEKCNVGNSHKCRFDDQFPDFEKSEIAKSAGRDR